MQLLLIVEHGTAPSARVYVVVAGQHQTRIQRRIVLYLCHGSDWLARSSMGVGDEV